MIPSLWGWDRDADRVGMGMEIKRKMRKRRSAMQIECITTSLKGH
jgi:hypothetical protein